MAGDFLDIRNSRAEDFLDLLKEGSDNLGSNLTLEVF